MTGWQKGQLVIVKTLADELLIKDLKERCLKTGSGTQN
jgi:hypothetical protein